VITENTGGDLGAGISIQAGAPKISECTISGNVALPFVGRGGGIYVCAGEACTPTIDRCKVTGNSAERGGGIFSGGNATISNSTVSGNSAPRGAGVYCNTSSPTIISTTIAGNTANQQGGGIYLDNSVGVTPITNCILWGNASDQIHIDGGTPPSVTYSDVQGDGVWPGDHNINQDPLFVGEGDYHLQEGSPCYDAGPIAEEPGDLSLDIDGQLRPCNEAYDMGSDEIAPPCGGCAVGPGGSPVRSAPNLAIYLIPAGFILVMRRKMAKRLST
jgi:predicted outer membrane repeat protein